ncbi:MAG: alginate export family protein [Pseudomonadales bacterium]|nr:alginate export family protein [Pseudomonadales bacterium]
MRMTPVVFGLLVLCVSLSSAKAADSIEEAFANGEGHINFRYRFENVDQDGFPNDAHASTLRTRLNYRTDSFNGLSFFAELDDITYLGDDDFNNTRNGQVTYPVVADPDGADVNQLYLDYKMDNTLLRLGRQRINLDNQRFVGGVGWRQNEQTYDALSLVNTALQDTKIQYTFVGNVSRIFGPEDGTPAKSIDSESHLINVNYKTSGDASVSGYAYLMELKDAQALSNRTIGLRYSRTFQSQDLTFPLNVEFANQKDYGDNPVSYSANYYLVEVGVSMDKVKVLVGNEVLEGNDTSAGEAFVTPLATLHKFQGWADKFLATPAAGIDDKYFTVSGNVLGGSLGLTYHVFEAESGSADYGTEWDVAYNRKLSDHLGLLLKLARYQEDGLSTDTTKAWVMLTADF